MSGKLKTLIANMCLSLATLFVCFLVLEFAVFGYILKPDDVLENVTMNGVVRYKPETDAIFRHPDGTTTKVTINRQGWNSTKPAYEHEKTPGRTRIAVVGDSYVHGAFVDVEKGFPHLLERKLLDHGRDVEVYRFGMDGAPLSQYLNMIRREVVAYHPDIVIVPLIHNDFDESYRFLKTRYASSFMKLRRNDNGEVVEVAQSEFKPGLADRLRAFATFRYLYYETGLYIKAKALVSTLFWGGTESYRPEFIQSAVDIRKIQDHASNRFFARYVFAQMKALAKKHGFKLVFVMDGVREAIYEGRDVAQYEVGKLNVIAADVARELDIPFVDLQDVFAADYARHHVRFEFPFDWHWNARANNLVAARIKDVIEHLPGPVVTGDRQRPGTIHAKGAKMLPAGSGIGG